jgi:hypothetical protein
MANVFSSICEMNLVSPPQPCSGRRSHRVEFQFSDHSRLQMFVCERHAANAGVIENALQVSGEFPNGAQLVETKVRELQSCNPLTAGLTLAPATE